MNLQERQRKSYELTAEKVKIRFPKVAIQEILGNEVKVMRMEIEQLKKDIHHLETAIKDLGGTIY